MNQQLTINKSIIDFFEKSLSPFENNDSIKIIELIEQNYIVSDFEKQYFNSIVTAIDNISDGIKRDFISKLFDNWIHNKKYFVKYTYNNEIDDEIKLSLESRDKIYFDPVLTQKQRDKIKIRYQNIEVHNQASFIKPESYEKLKHLPTIINLDKDIKYDLTKIIEPFIRNAREIEIIDPYLPNEYASRNLFKMFDLFFDKNITLVYLSEKEFVGKGDKSEQQEKLYSAFLSTVRDKQQAKFRVKLEMFKQKRHYERYIRTEHIQISLPGGFDFLKSDGTPNIIPSEKYDFKYLRIEKREKTSE